MSESELTRAVLSLHIYPIKGCRGINTKTAITTPTGFAYDRQWVIVKEENMRFVNQKIFTRLTQIEPQLPMQLVTGEIAEPTEQMFLEIKFPIQRSLKLPLVQHSVPQLKEISVYEWRGLAQDEGDEVAEKLSEFLEAPVRLFRFTKKQEPEGSLFWKSTITRKVDSRFAVGYGTAFADGYPYLIINQSSVCALDEQIGRQIPADRFRANIVILGNASWEEDNWRQIKIIPSDEESSECHFTLVKPCDRCKVTTIDQKTAYADFEPLATLRSVHNGTTTGFASRLPETRKSGFFGWNAVCPDIGRVSVGDSVFSVKEGSWNTVSLTDSLWSWFQQLVIK